MLQINKTIVPATFTPGGGESVSSPRPECEINACEGVGKVLNNGTIACNAAGAITGEVTSGERNDGSVLSVA